MKNKNLLVLVAVGTLLFGMTSATSDYMHYQTVNGIGTISICDPDSNGTKCITMQDRNLGATEAGIGCRLLDYECSQGFIGEGFDDYESCYQVCIDYGVPTATCEHDCTQDFKGYSDYESCNIAMSNAFAICNERNSGVYGYHFQRGNNHEFAIGCYEDRCSDTVTSSAVTTKATWDNSYNNYGYIGAITNFMKGSGDYWKNNSHYDGLRGGANDSQENNRGFNETGNVAINATGRRGPCGEGYHVPSIGEWNQVLEYWGKNNIDERLFRYSDKGLLYLKKCAEGVDVVCYDDFDDQVECDSEDFSYYDCEDWEYDETFGLSIQEDFKIPFAGYRSWYDAMVEDVGDYAKLWSSSPVGVNARGYARDFILQENKADVCGNYARADAVSVRCFKDSYLSFPTNENGDSGSGSASTHVTLTLTAGSNTCTLNDYNLGTHNASAEEQYVESSGQDIVCEFLQNTGVIVLLSMGNLTDGTKVIGAENFTGVVTAIGNSLGSISNLIGGNYNLSGSQEIYRKAVNTLGKWTGDLQIIGTIPAGTPSGTYTGSLEIVIQEG